MPKIVDPEERKLQISHALLSLVSRDGLEGVSLRKVAQEAGVTTGMVQHYFPSKHSMMEFAMRAASERYEQRIGDRMTQLGANPQISAVIAALLGALLPGDAEETADARIGLAFQSYAVTQPDAAEHLREGNNLLRDHLAELIRSENSKHPDPLSAATGLFAAAEGLGVHLLSGQVSVEEARLALHNLITLILNPKSSAA